MSWYHGRHKQGEHFQSIRGYAQGTDESQVLGLALLSTVSLAIPFEEQASTLHPRDAEALAEAEAKAEALLDAWESDLETREADHHWVGARDISDDDFGSMLEVRDTRCTP